MSRLDLSEILPAHLYLGAGPGVAHVDELRAQGVTAVLSCIHASDPYQVPLAVRQAFHWHQVPIVDSHFGGVPTVDHLIEAVAQLSAWRRAGEVLYVHCFAGQGRSPTVAMAYLVAGHREPGWRETSRLTAAIAHVRHQRPAADPNVHQLRVLCDYVASVVEG